MLIRKACPTRLHTSAACNLHLTQGCVRQDMILPHQLHAAHLIRPLIVQQLATEVVAHNLVLLDLHHRLSRSAKTFPFVMNWGVHARGNGVTSPQLQYSPGERGKFLVASLPHTFLVALYFLQDDKSWRPCSSGGSSLLSSMTPTLPLAAGVSVC